MTRIVFFFVSVSNVNRDSMVLMLLLAMGQKRSIEKIACEYE